jgi:hypothetical protein
LQCVTAGITGSQAPLTPAVGKTVADGSVVWVVLNAQVDVS